MHRRMRPCQTINRTMCRYGNVKVSSSSCLETNMLWKQLNSNWRSSIFSTPPPNISPRVSTPSHACFLWLLQVMQKMIAGQEKREDRDLHRIYGNAFVKHSRRLEKIVRLGAIHPSLHWRRNQWRKIRKRHCKEKILLRQWFHNHFLLIFISEIMHRSGPHPKGLHFLKRFHSLLMPLSESQLKLSLAWWVMQKTWVLYHAGTWRV